MQNKLIKLILLLLSIGFINLMLVHLLRTNGNWISNTLSNYAINEYGIIMQVGFIFIALACITIGILFKNTTKNISKQYPLNKIILIKIISWLFWFCALSIVTAIIFPVSINGLVITTTDYLHLISALALSFTLPLIVLFVGIVTPSSFKLFKLYSYIYFTALVFGVATTTHFVLTNLMTGLLETTTLGLTEKVGSLFFLLWIIIFLLNSKKIFQKIKPAGPNRL